MRLINTFEGGTDEVTITAANSGGASGNAFDAVASGTGWVRVFDTGQSMYGSMAMRMSCGATAATGTISWTTSLGAGLSRIYVRHYFRGDYTVGARGMHRFRGTGVSLGRVEINTSGQMRLINTSSTIVATGTAVLDTATWYRFESSLGSGSSTLNVARVYEGNSTQILDEVSGTSDFGTGNIDEVNFGQTVSFSNIPAAWWDSIEVRDDGYPGPFVRQTAALGAG